MITFVTLFLGLTAGRQRISLAADSAVTLVEIRIDGRTFQTLTKPPWEADFDFGAELLPHRILARALDGSGRELGHAMQLFNVPRPVAEGEILFERGSDGQPVAVRATWESVTQAKPRRFEVQLDGHRISVKEPSRFALPRYDGRRVHMLVVELEFSAFEKVRLERAFGGGVAENAARELTAVPITVGKREPDGKVLSAALSVDGGPVRVTAVESGPAKVTFVRSAKADEWFDPSKSKEGSRSSGPGSLSPLGPSSGSRFVEREPGRFDMALGNDDQVRFLYPVPLVSNESRLPTNLFPSSPYYFTAEHGGIPYLLRSYTMSFGENAPERLADAVAVAGLQVAGGNQPRAVVLLCSNDPPDGSQFSSDVVRGYLRRIGVPLFVWCVGAGNCADARARWGELEEIGTGTDLRRAVSRLKKELKRQRIVWVEGSWLAQEVVLRSPVDGLKLLAGQ